MVQSNQTHTRVLTAKQAHAWTNNKYDNVFEEHPSRRKVPAIVTAVIAADQFLKTKHERLSIESEMGGPVPPCDFPITADSRVILETIFAGKFTFLWAGRSAFVPWIRSRDRSKMCVAVFLIVAVGICTSALFTGDAQNSAGSALGVITMSPLIFALIVWVRRCVRIRNRILYGVTANEVLIVNYHPEYLQYARYARDALRYAQLRTVIGSIGSIVISRLNDYNDVVESEATAAFRSLDFIEDAETVFRLIRRIAESE